MTFKNFVRGMLALPLFCVAVPFLLLSALLAATLAPADAHARPALRGQAGYYLIDCNPFVGVAQNGKATASWDNLVGYTVDRIILQLGGAGNTKANHTNIKIIANEKTILEDSGTRIDARMQYRGITANAAFLVLDFSEIRARTIVGQRVGSLDTISAGIRKLTAEIDIGAAAAAPTLTAFAMLADAPQRDPYTKKVASTAPLIAKVVAKTFNPGAAGEFPFPFEYQRVAGSFVKRIHLFGATVTDARMKRNGMDVWKASDARNDFLQAEFGRTPQANQLTMDFVLDGNMSDMMPMENIKSLEPYVTVNGAGNVVVVAELLDLLTNN